MEKRSWGVHIEFAILFITLLGGFYTLDSKIDYQVQQQAQRTDKLYEMFIDLVKERK